MPENIVIYPIKGMHCASCAATIEKTLKKEEGVNSVEVNYGTETAKISLDESKTSAEKLSKKIEPYGYSLLIKKAGGRQMSASEMGMTEEEHKEHLGLNQSKEEKIKEIRSLKKRITISLPIAGITIFFMFLSWGALSELPKSIIDILNFSFFIFATFILLYIGKPYLAGIYRFTRYGKANMDTLIGIGTSVAFLYSIAVTFFSGALSKYMNVDHTYFDVTIVVITFITLGKYLEARSKLKTGDAIEKLLGLQAKTATIIRDGQEIEISIDKVVVGDLVVIKPGAKIPVDGVVEEGNSFVNESMITGEPMPIEKKKGDMVVAGTINENGTFIFKATKVGSETMLSHIIKMVEEAQGSKAPIQALADKISAVFVPIILVLAVLTFALWITVGASYLGFDRALSIGLTSFVGILVIACPCALGLATPTAIIVGVGKGAKEGILIKDAATLEKLYKIDTVVVDKTGTITKGKPELVSLENFSNKSDDELIEILASLEKRSEHPIAHAIIKKAEEKKLQLPAITDFESLKGKGIKALIGGEKYFAGSVKLIEELSLSLDKNIIDIAAKEGKTPVILATREKVLGIFFVADAIKDEAREAVRLLHNMGIKILMLTGDNKETADYIASLVNIDEVKAQVMPEDKLTVIKNLQNQGHTVAMAGDGVNDAPALAQADVGIAMATGTDVAIESAGITLLHGDISKIAKAIRLSKLIMKGVKQNLFWAFFYNILGIPLAGGLFYPIFGILLNPVFAGLAMAFSSVSVVGNSLRIKNKKL